MYYKYGEVQLSSRQTTTYEKSFPCKGLPDRLKYSQLFCNRWKAEILSMKASILICCFA